MDNFEILINFEYNNQIRNITLFLTKQHLIFFYLKDYKKSLKFCLTTMFEKPRVEIFVNYWKDIKEKQFVLI